MGDWSSDTYNPCPGVLEGVPASRGYEGGFGTQLMIKDLALALQAAQQAGVSLRAAPNAAATYGEAAASGLGNKDFGAVYRLLAELSSGD